MNMVFLGPPGVGKGTHAGLVAEKYGIPQISTGDILREMIKKGHELGLQAQKYMDEGGLVPDELVIKILKERISEEDCKKGFILDGFPRTIPQAEALEDITHIEIVVNFDAPSDVIIQRITGRWTCKHCGEIFHEKNIPPKKEGICDKCGSELYQRDDQKIDVVENRLKVYERDTLPLIDFYKKMGVVLTVKAEGEIKEVHTKIINLLEQKMNG